MKKIRVYLDNCCFNRPFDDQQQIKIKLEAQAKIFIQKLIREQKLELVWSYILDFENNKNPFSNRRQSIAAWKEKSILDVDESESLLQKAEIFMKNRIAATDALHLAAAIEAGVDYFFTTDYLLIRKTKNISGIKIMNPTQFFIEKENFE
jgi:predicted nucleic acid-binding protein